MSYRIEKDEALSDALGRIAAEEIALALAELRRPNRAQAMHNTRKSLKRLRSLLRSLARRLSQESVPPGKPAAGRGGPQDRPPARCPCPVAHSGQAAGRHRSGRQKNRAQPAAAAGRFHAENPGLAPRGAADAFGFARDLRRPAVAAGHAGAPGGGAEAHLQTGPRGA